MNRTSISTGTASVIVALVGLVGTLAGKFLDDYLKRRERRSTTTA